MLKLKHRLRVKILIVWGILLVISFPFTMKTNEQGFVDLTHPITKIYFLLIFVFLAFAFAALPYFLEAIIFKYIGVLSKIVPLRQKTKYTTSFWSGKTFMQGYYKDRLVEVNIEGYGGGRLYMHICMINTISRISRGKNAKTSQKTASAEFPINRKYLKKKFTEDNIIANLEKLYKKSEASEAKNI